MSKSKNLWSAILWTLLIVVIFRAGVYVHIPFINLDNLNSAVTGDDAGLFSMLNSLGGGALSQYSLFGLGVAPYITASIIIQLFAMGISPKLTELRESGSKGKKTIDLITRVFTFVIAIIQGVLITVALNNQKDIFQLNTDLSGVWLIILASVLLASGTMFLLWLADIITQKGLGQGVSIIIFVGIVDKVPISFYNLGKVVMEHTLWGLPLWVVILGVVALFFILLWFTIKINQSQRNIPVIYPKGGGNSKNSIMFKVNIAGVIPVIFASAIMLVPATIVGVFPNTNSEFLKFLQDLFNYNTWWGLGLYLVLIVFFAFLYSILQINPKKLSENLNRSGGYIAGIKPGDDTKNYITSIIKRITLIGALGLCIIVVVPMILPMMFTSVTGLSMYAIGGTGMIIAVGVSVTIWNKIKELYKTDRVSGETGYKKGKERGSLIK